MGLLFSYLFMIISWTVSIQNDPTEVDFYRDLIRQFQAEGQIIYTDKISKGDIDNIKSHLKSKTLFDVSHTINQNSVTLTRQEIKYISDQLESFSYDLWQENLFSGAKLIKESDVMSFIKKTNQVYLENYNNPNNTETDRMTMVKNYQRPNVFKFSKPIYLRNKSLCLIYFSSVCGNPCGFDELCFYKIENSTWTKWVVVNSKQY